LFVTADTVGRQRGKEMLGAEAGGNLITPSSVGLFIVVPKPCHFGPAGLAVLFIY
jgi:hypothetical protein